MPSPFLRLLQEEQVDVIELCSGRTKNGDVFYAFVQMNIEGYERYQKAVALKKPVDLNMFGVILHAGWGEKPDEATCERIRREYTDNQEILEIASRDALALETILKRNSKDCDNDE